MVYFPNGNYYASYLSIGAGVVLEGQSEYGTKLYYDGAGGSSFIKSQGTGSLGGVAQLQGIGRLSMLLKTDSIRPDVFMNLGDTTIVSTDQTLRTSNRIFVADVNLSYSYMVGYAQPNRGIGLQIAGNEYALVENDYFQGWAATAGNALNQYYIVKNNYFENSLGSDGGYANYAFYENNTINFHPEYDQNTDGISARADTYIANNTILGSGDASNVNNDGEAVNIEAPGTSFCDDGTVTSATATSITVSPAVPLVNDPVEQYGTLCVVITLGTGLGELATVRRGASTQPPTPSR